MTSGGNPPPEPAVTDGLRTLGGLDIQKAFQSAPGREDRPPSSYVQLLPSSARSIHWGHSGRRGTQTPARCRSCHVSRGRFTYRWGWYNVPREGRDSGERDRRAKEPLVNSLPSEAGRGKLSAHPPSCWRKAVSHPRSSKEPESTESWFPTGF